MDSESLQLLEDGLRKAMTTASGQRLDAVLADLGWLEMLDEMPDAAVPLVFRLLGETGAHAPVLNDVVLRAAGREAGGTVPLPFAGGSWVVWERADQPSSALGDDLRYAVRPRAIRCRLPPDGMRSAGGWWAPAARCCHWHASTLWTAAVRSPVASFQAIRHRLAETLVAIEGAEATLVAAAAEPDDLSFLLAKAAAGQAALAAARHCQQVLGGIGFTAEHELHRHLKRALVLDGLLGSSRELTREAGATLRAKGFAPRLVQL